MTIWEERLCKLLDFFEDENKSLEEKAEKLKELCHSHYCDGYRDGNIDGGSGNWYTPKLSEYV